MSRRPPKPPIDAVTSPDKAKQTPAVRPKFATTQLGGGKLFSTDASKVREALPSAEEGDALFDQLFDGGTQADGDELPTQIPETDDGETETHVFTYGDVVRAASGDLSAEGENNSDDRETLFFNRWAETSVGPEEDGPASMAGADETSTVIRSSLDETGTSVFGVGAGSADPFETNVFVSLAAEDFSDLSRSYRVEGLSMDRGSAEELELDDVELLAELEDAFGGLAPRLLASQLVQAGVQLDLPQTALAPSSSRPPESGLANKELPTLRVPEASTLPPGDGILSDISVRARGEFPIVQLPSFDEDLVDVVPAPARSIPFSLIAHAAVPPSAISADGFEVFLDEDGYLDEAVGSAPPSHASLLAARESVAGWLSAVDSSLPPADVEEFVFSSDDIEEVPPSILPVPPARRPLESLDIFTEAPGDFVSAVVALVERGERQAWLDRAQRLLVEAPTENAAARASALLVVSELFAIGGDAETAEKVALEALQLAPTAPMMQRQVRGLLAARRAWPEVAEQLAREARSAPTEASRAHAAYLAAEIARLKLSDSESTTRMIERGRAADATDVRGPLAQWVAVAKNCTAKLEAPQGSAESAFVAAEGELAALRSNGLDGARAETRFGKLLAARVGLRRRDAGTAISLLLDVGTEPGLRGAAGWLAAVLGAPDAELRVRGSAALLHARTGSHGAMATRLGVAHALERGDFAAVGAALRDGDGLPANDRLFLAALLPPGENVPSIAELLEATAGTSVAERPLVAASAALFGARLPASMGLGDQHGKLRVKLAADLISLGSAVSTGVAHARIAPTIDALTELEPTDGVARAFAIETRYLAGQPSQLLGSLGGGSAEERALAAGVFAELGGDFSAMTAWLEPFAKESAPALRMLLTRVPKEQAARYLESCAALADDSTAALYLTEAACRLRGDAARADALWTKVYERDEQSTIAPLFGFASALGAGVPVAARQWLTRCKLEPIHEQILEGLRLSPPGSPERLVLLAEAHRQRPQDVALRDQFEFSGGGTSDRAAWLEDRCSEPRSDVADFAVEAALLYEGAGLMPSAARAIAAAGQGSLLAESVARRLAFAGHGTALVTDRVLSSRLRAEDPEIRRDLDAELARLAWHGGKDFAAAAGYWRDMLTGGSLDLVALLDAEWMLFEFDSPQTQASIEFALARVVTGTESVAHAMLAVRRARRGDNPGLALDAARLAAVLSRRGSWSLRQLAELSHIRRDFAGIWRSACDLAEQTVRPLERAALLCRAAEAAFAAGDDASANSLLGDVFLAWPKHPVARLLRASVLERSGATLQAAVAFEELAGMTRSRRDRAQRCYKAATLWLASNDPRAAVEGQRLLEAACDLEPEHIAAFERLQAIYLAGGSRMELAELLSQRARTVVDPNQRGELEVLRGRMLADAGASGEAKVALAASLKLRPDDIVAWRAYAEVAITEQDGEAAEQALLQLGRLVTDRDERVDVYLRLGDVYSRLRPNHERARRAYREAEKLDPSRIDIRERWIELQAAMGDPAGAVAAQRALCEQASSPEDVCSRTVALSWLHERLRELAEAEKVLVDLRRHHALATLPLKALHAFYVRQSKRGLADGLLERTLVELSRLLIAGRLDEGVFDIAKAVAELRGRVDGVAVVEVVRTAAHGGSSRIGAAGRRAGQHDLDGLLAPEVFTPELRELLQATGHLLDAATPFDSRAMRTRPLTQNEEFVTRAREIAKQHGLSEIDFVVANALPATVVPVSMSPVVFCVAASLLDSASVAFVELAVHRAAVLVRTRTAALARTSPIEQWPVLAAYLRLHEPKLVPLNVDPTKLDELEARMRGATPSFVPDPRLAALARTVFDSMGHRGSSLGGSGLSWSWRVAAMAHGDIGVTLDAMALAVGTTPLPQAGLDRIRWLTKQPEARDLFGFLVSDAHLAVRSRLGLIVPMKE